jgi:hypothetical protein
MRISIVFHRIVDRDGERFITKGDHNSWRDFYHPLPADLAGRLWIHIPAAGRLATPLWAPVGKVILTALLGIIIMTSLHDTEAPRRGRRARRRSGGNPSGLPKPPAFAADGLLAAVLLVAVTSLLLAFVGFRHRTTQSVIHTVSYQQAGSFSYSAAAPASVYGTDGVLTGDPVYLKLVQALPVSFDYQFTTAEPHTIHGSYRMLLELSQGNGWKRSIELVPPTPFSGDQQNITGVIDFAALRGVMSTLEDQTGVKGAQYGVAVVPSIELEGEVSGKAVTSTFAPRLPFHLDASQFASTSRPTRPDAGLRRLCH